MKLRNNVIFIFLLAVVFFAASISSTSTLLMGAKFNKYDDFKRYEFDKRASEKGFVRVIVKFDVPGIDVLTAQSTRFRTGITDTTYIQAALNADLALEEAISTSRDDILHQLNGQPYRILRSFSTLPLVVLLVNRETLDKLYTIPGVLDIAEDQLTSIRKPLEFQRSTDEKDIDELKLRQSTALVGADVAWGFGYTGSGWYVAILDTGIRASHEMFQGKTIVEQCFALGPNRTDPVGDCPNGQIEMSGPGAAAHHDTRFGHGSHVAGIAAGNNGFSQYGVARGADIIAVNVFSYFPDEGYVGSWVSDQVKGLEYIYTIRNSYPIAAANMSLGGYEKFTDYCDTDSRQLAISNLRAAGIATTISAGNEGNCDGVSSPACISTAIAVNGTDKFDNEYSSGNWHDVMVALMAPGVTINSASGLTDHSYDNRTGTSMSAPHVAGAWAIMKQYNPNMTVDEILNVLQDTGTMISSTRCEGRAAKPRLNVGEALVSLLSIAPPKNLLVEQKENKSLLVTEYINVITWESNPYNQDKNITQYKIYVVQGSQFNLLAEVSASTFIYLHRKVEKEQEMMYAVTAVDAQGQESSPAYFPLEFN
jgi:subtilisin family serine protease